MKMTFLRTEIRLMAQHDKSWLRRFSLTTVSCANSAWKLITSGFTQGRVNSWLKCVSKGSYVSKIHFANNSYCKSISCSFCQHHCCRYIYQKRLGRQNINKLNKIKHERAEPKTCNVSKLPPAERGSLEWPLLSWFQIRKHCWLSINDFTTMSGKKSFCVIIHVL